MFWVKTGAKQAVHCPFGSNFGSNKKNHCFDCCIRSVWSIPIRLSKVTLLNYAWKKRGKLFGGTVPPNNTLFGGTVPPNRKPDSEISTISALFIENFLVMTAPKNQLKMLTILKNSND